YSHRRRKGLCREQLGVQGIEEELNGREPLLAIDNRSLLHQPDRLLHLLHDYCSQEMWLVLIVRPLEQPVRHANDIFPEGLPLVLLVPDVRSLEKGDNQPLRLHEHHLWRADLGLHRPSLAQPELTTGCSDYS